ncbi:jg5857 [Pararge aegeria aegeria]|uniref:Jg5857 protein n=1 Tax=Pararge aegeria aegeria TaxID=348720 RepID=A0A8S4SMG5_9NEOP|nr:jg5857 [Pararge aegeria aegeria]
MWASLKETVAGVVALQAVERGVWNTRFSDVYALCVAHPEPLADRLYDETRNFLEEHVAGLLERVQRSAPLESSDYNDGLLNRYVAAWHEYSQGVAYLNSLYSYLNLQHVKRQKVSDAEIIYGSSATVSCPQHDSRQLEVGELGLVTWERVLVRPLATALSSRLVAALNAARDSTPDPSTADTLRSAIHSTVHVQAFRVRAPLSLYVELVLDPFLAAATTHHSRRAACLLAEGDISHFMKYVLDGLEREISLARRFLHSSSIEAVRACYEQACVEAHLAALYADIERLLKEASAGSIERQDDLRRMYALLKPLGADALRPLVDAAHHQAVRDGLALLDAEHPKDEAHSHFVQSMLSLHHKYSELFSDVFGGAQPFVGALDKACSAVVNRRWSGEPCARAPELVARYCDTLLRRRGADSEADDKLASAILSASMEQEEAMINRLKAACGYEFTNKLHRMFTDVAVSADLNAKFQQHLRDNNLTTNTGFFIQVLQAGAWPLGGAMAPLAPPAQLERPARLFEAFYRASFSGRRLAWLHHLCTGELRTKYTQRMYHLSGTTPQCALLLMFENTDVVSAREARETLQVTEEAWARHVKPLIDAGLLTAKGELHFDSPENDEGELVLNLSFTCKRTRIKLTCAAAPPNQGGGAGSSSGATSSETAHCDDDRKMYLQAALVRIMKQRKVLRHTELIQEVVSQARGSFAPSVAMIKKCIEALIDKQYLERAPGTLDTYSYLA